MDIPRRHCGDSVKLEGDSLNSYKNCMKGVKVLVRVLCDLDEYGTLNNLCKTLMVHCKTLIGFIETLRYI